MDVSVVDAKNQLSALLQQVARGEEITITRRGQPIAKLIAVAPRFDKDAAKRAADGLREASRGLTLGGIKIKDLIEEGRD